MALDKVTPIRESLAATARVDPSRTEAADSPRAAWENSSSKCGALAPLKIIAINTAADSENKIHDDRVAAQFGFRGGLVPGVTVYGYLAEAVMEHFGAAWAGAKRHGSPDSPISGDLTSDDNLLKAGTDHSVHGDSAARHESIESGDRAVCRHFQHTLASTGTRVRGAIDVRFRQPVYEGEEVGITINPEADHRVHAEIADHASAIAWIHDEPVPALIELAPPPAARRAATKETLAPGTILGSISKRLDLSEAKLSAPLDPMIPGAGVSGRDPAFPRAAIDQPNFAHPAILLGLANEIFVMNYELGPWIHSASEVRKFSAARDGELISVRAKVEQEFERKGHEIVVLIVQILGPHARLIEHIRHTAIWQPRPERREPS